MRSAGIPEERIAGTTAGTPEQVHERAHAYREVGIEGLTFSLPDVHDLEAVALAGETLAPVFNPQ
jgi:alkanesulfonate monooxygenase SsuD/methylene tetrahydromethanopterin reductase-like flavin-dependent oxidoreductase (luciferase family)